MCSFSSAWEQDFAENELLPFAAQWDEQKHFPVEVFRKAAKLGFGGIFCGHDVGGSQYVLPALLLLSVEFSVAVGAGFRVLGWRQGHRLFLCICRISNYPESTRLSAMNRL